MFENCSLRIDEVFQSENILNLCKCWIILAMKQAKDSILAELHAKTTDKIEYAWMSKADTI